MKNYPKWVYHESGASKIVETAEEQAALGGGWAETPYVKAEVPAPGDQAARIAQLEAELAAARAQPSAPAVPPAIPPAVPPVPVAADGTLTPEEQAKAKEVHAATAAELITNIDQIEDKALLADIKRYEELRDPVRVTVVKAVEARLAKLG